MALSFVLYNGNGSLKDFTITFPWINNGHLDVRVGGVTKVETTDWTVSGTTLTFVVAPPSGTNNVYIGRATTKTARLVDFANGGGVNESNLDSDSNQLFYILQENADGVLTIPVPGTDDNKFAKASSTGTLEWYDLFAGANAWTGNQTFAGTSTFNGGGTFTGNVLVNSPYTLNVANPANLQVGGTNIFARANTWSNNQIFTGTSTFNGNVTTGATQTLNVTKTDGLQVGGTNIFARANAWTGNQTFAGTSTFNGNVALGATQTLNVPLDTGLQVGGTNIFARGNTWTGVQTFNGNVSTGASANLNVTKADGLQVAGTAIPITKEYVSSAQTITSAGLLSLTHGLGGEPDHVQLVLACTTAEHGYSIGNRIFISPGAQHGNATDRANVVVPTSTQVQVRFSSDANCFAYAHKLTGVAVELTNANWTLEVRAYA